MIQPDLETSLEALTQRVDVLERRPVARIQPAAVATPEIRVKEDVKQVNKPVEVIKKETDL